MPGFIAIAISLSSLLISFAGLSHSKQQANFGKEQAEAAREQSSISQQTLDIATGKRATRIECVDYFPKIENFKADDEVMLGGANGYKQRFFHNANSMVMLAPAVFVNNDGQDALDSVRVEVSFVGGFIDRTTDKTLVSPTDWYKRDTPVIRRPSHQEEYVLSRFWQPGECLRLVILKGVLDQITQVSSKTNPDKIDKAELSVVIVGRIAGSSVFSSTTANPMLYRVAWKPDGFPEDETKPLLETYKPSNLFGERRKSMVPLEEITNLHRGTYNDMRERFPLPHATKWHMTVCEYRLYNYCDR